MHARYADVLDKKVKTLQSTSLYHKLTPNYDNAVCVFCSDMKFKMAATAGLSLTLDPMGKMFQNASSLKPLG